MEIDRAALDLELLSRESHVVDDRPRKREEARVHLEAREVEREDLVEPEVRSRLEPPPHLAETVARDLEAEDAFLAAGEVEPLAHEHGETIHEPCGARVESPDAVAGPGELLRLVRRLVGERAEALHFRRLVMEGDDRPLVELEVAGREVERADSLGGVRLLHEVLHRAEDVDRARLAARAAALGTLLLPEDGLALARLAGPDRPRDLLPGARLDEVHELRADETREAGVLLESLPGDGAHDGVDRRVLRVAHDRERRVPGRALRLLLRDRLLGRVLHRLPGIARERDAHLLELDDRPRGEGEREPSRRSRDRQVRGRRREAAEARRVGEVVAAEQEVALLPLGDELAVALRLLHDDRLVVRGVHAVNADREGALADPEAEAHVDVVPRGVAEVERARVVLARSVRPHGLGVVSDDEVPLDLPCPEVLGLEVVEPGLRGVEE